MTWNSVSSPYFFVYISMARGAFSSAVMIPFLTEQAIVPPVSTVYIFILILLLRSYFLQDKDGEFRKDGSLRVHLDLLTKQWYNIA